MAKLTKSDALDLSKYEVPADLLALYHALQKANGDAIQSVKRGETRQQREWRLASRLCREFLSATEEPAQLAFGSELGNWPEVRKVDSPPENPHTYVLWLAAQAWRLLSLCLDGLDDDDLDGGYIEPVRHCAREGVIAVKTIPMFQRVHAQRVANGEHKVTDRERGPKLKKAGTKPGLRLVPKD